MYYVNINWSIWKHGTELSPSSFARVHTTREAAQAATSNAEDRVLEFPSKNNADYVADMFNIMCYAASYQNETEEDQIDNQVIVKDCLKILKKYGLH